MRCIKNDAAVLVQDTRGIFVTFGDAFVLGGEGHSFYENENWEPGRFLLFRGVSTKLLVKCGAARVHALCTAQDAWFDWNSSSSTLVAAPDQWIWLGYSGVTLENAARIATEARAEKPA